MRTRAASPSARTPLPERIAQYWHTVRYLRAAQILHRLDLRGRAAARRASPRLTRGWYARRAAAAGLDYVPDPWQLRGTAPAARARISPPAAAKLRQEAVEIERGTFTFLNHQRSLGRPVDWSAAGSTQLWRYHLHYFDVVPELAAAGAMDTLSDLLEDWTTRVAMADPGSGDAWHPYVVSLRIVNWMIGCAAAPLSWQPSERVLESLRVQTLFVLHNLERDVGGNHLLKNLKALAIAGCFWSGRLAARLGDRFLLAFVDALEAQLRSDGGHYEQSPMYHAQVMADAIELAMIRRLRHRPDPRLEAVIDRMDQFLSRVCHPDGELAQFGDTAGGMTPAPAALLAAARHLRGRSPDAQLVPRHALLADPRIGQRSTETEARIAATETAPPWHPEASGVLTLDTLDGRAVLIADAGPVCPDDLPAHAHADLFGFELSVDRTRMVVDAGVSEYAPGPWREYFRSTRAHNTVMLDEVEQSECWGSFRVARRAHVIDRRVENGPGFRGYSSAHDGYVVRPQPIIHRRHFLAVADRMFVLIDQLDGAGLHEWTTFIHLHPEAALTRDGLGGFLAARDSARLRIAWFGVDEPSEIRGAREPLQGWHAPAFGEVHPSSTLVARARRALPGWSGWLLVPDPGEGERFEARLEGALLSIHAGGSRHDIPITPPADQGVRS